jgi:hypothetical protein
MSEQGEPAHRLTAITIMIVVVPKPLESQVVPVAAIALHKAAALVATAMIIVALRRECRSLRQTERHENRCTGKSNFL